LSYARDESASASPPPSGSMADPTGILLLSGAPKSSWAILADIAGLDSRVKNVEDEGRNALANDGVNQRVSCVQGPLARIRGDKAIIG